MGVFIFKKVCWARYAHIIYLLSLSFTARLSLYSVSTFRTRSTMKRPPTGYVKSKCQGKKKKRIFEEIADELFSLNTQVSTNNSHELGGKVKRSATSFSWAGEMGHWRGSCDGFFPTNKWTHKQNKTTKVERQIIALLLKSLLAFSLHIFILKCGYISKILWKHSIHSCNAETTL